jgi:hypothetical protein
MAKHCHILIGYNKSASAGRIAIASRVAADERRLAIASANLFHGSLSFVGHDCVKHADSPQAPFRISTSS